MLRVSASVAGAGDDHMHFIICETCKMDVRVKTLVHDRFIPQLRFTCDTCGETTTVKIANSYGTEGADSN